ncbi:MAG: hypothetical protein NC548_31860, partial [Lachnospiraceae bacterium]|nr:hypothetical protein [Lachnospiraceae bacterium]
AEKTAPVAGVVYSTVDQMKLISTFRTTNPLTETVAGQMLALTVIENVDSIYWLNIPAKQPDQENLSVNETTTTTTKSSAKKTE